MNYVVFPESLDEVTDRGRGFSAEICKTEISSHIGSYMLGILALQGGRLGNEELEVNLDYKSKTLPQKKNT
jgi:hypothetical protein